MKEFLILFGIMTISLKMLNYDLQYGGPTWSIWGSATLLVGSAVALWIHCNKEGKNE